MKTNFFYNENVHLFIHSSLFVLKTIQAEPASPPARLTTPCSWVPSRHIFGTT